MSMWSDGMICPQGPEGSWKVIPGRHKGHSWTETSEEHHFLGSGPVIGSTKIPSY